MVESPKSPRPVTFFCGGKSISASCLVFFLSICICTDQHDDGVLEVELARPPVHHQQELEPVGLDQGAAVLLVIEGVTEVPASGVKDAGLVPGE